MLDLVEADTADMERRLGPADCAVLREYLDTVRNVERRVEKAEARMRPPVESPPDMANRLPNACI